MRIKFWGLLKNVTIAIFCIPIFYNCSNTVNEPKAADEPTPVIFKLTIVNPPASVYSIVGLLERNGHDPVNETFVISGDTAIGDFGSIAAGTWHLSVTAYDSNQIALYFGETDVAIQAGQLNVVNLHMNPLTGELLVVVTWGGTINPSDSTVVAYYPFSGNANDMSGNGYDGTVAGAELTDDRFNNPNSAYFFNGIDDYIVLPSDFDFQERTISIWFKAFSIDLIWKRIYNSDHANLNHASTNIDIYIDPNTNEQFVRLTAGGGPAEDIPCLISLNEWYHAVITVGPSYTKAYINGVFLGSAPFLNHHSIGGYPYAFVGANRDLLRYFFHGVLDDVRIYDRVLDIGEIQALYHENGW